MCCFSSWYNLFVSILFDISILLHHLSLTFPLIVTYVCVYVCYILCDNFLDNYNLHSSYNTICICVSGSSTCSLNLIWTRMIPVDMLTWMEESSQGFKSTQRTAGLVVWKHGITYRSDYVRGKECVSSQLCQLSHWDMLGEGRVTLQMGQLHPNTLFRGRTWRHHDICKTEQNNDGGPIQNTWWHMH